MFHCVLKLQLLFAIMSKKCTRNYLQVLQHEYHCIWREGGIYPFWGTNCLPIWLCSCIRTQWTLSVPCSRIQTSRAQRAGGAGLFVLCCQSQASAPSPWTPDTSEKSDSRWWALTLALGRRPGHRDTTPALFFTPSLWWVPCTKESVLGFSGWSSLWEMHLGLLGPI